MGSRMQGLDAYKGVTIYNSANTHPNAKTKSLVIFQACHKSNTRRRYKVGDAQSYKKAYLSLAKVIDHYFETHKK
jgi:hypothetical protein